METSSGCNESTAPETIREIANTASFERPLPRSFNITEALAAR
jgi:hypothetical protein